MTVQPREDPGTAGYLDRLAAVPVGVPAVDPENGEMDREAAVASFAAWLRALKLHAGDPSYRELERQAARIGRPVPRSTLHDGLTGDRLLALEHALTVVYVLAGRSQGLLVECRSRWIAARAGRVMRALEPVPPDGFTTVSTGPESSFVGGALRITEARVGAWTVLRVVGEADVYTAPHLRQRLKEVCERRPIPQVVVDMRQVSFVDSTCLGVMVYGLKKFRDQGVVLRAVMNARGEKDMLRVYLTFQRTGLGQVLPLYLSMRQALTHE